MHIVAVILLRNYVSVPFPCYAKLILCVDFCLLCAQCLILSCPDKLVRPRDFEYLYLYAQPI